MTSAPLATNRPQLLLTDAQFEDMARRGAFVKVGRVELRRGVITPMSPVFLGHANLHARLVEALGRAIAEAQLSLRLNFELSIRFGGGFQPTADIVLWDPGMVAEESGPLPGAAARLVVEVADASLGDDLGEKQLDYARAGLPEYWVADVKDSVILRHAEPAEEGYRTRSSAPLAGRVEALTLALAADLG